jgi:two-component system, LytTR family, response regulator
MPLRVYESDKSIDEEIVQEMANTKISLVVADDDPVFRAYLNMLLTPLVDFEIKNIFEDAWTTLHYLQQHKVDIAILDVEMPGLTGLELARSLTTKPLFIFVTSHPGYAVEGFEVEAVDYILKPIQKERLIKALQKAQALLHTRPMPAETTQANPADDDDFVFVRDKSDYIKIELASIVFVEAMGDFVQIHLDNNHKQLVLVNLKNFESQLNDKHFMRISRTHLVNLRKITAMRHQQLELGEHSIPIGKSYLQQVESAILQKRTIKRFIE